MSKSRRNNNSSRSKRKRNKDMKNGNSVSSDTDRHGKNQKVNILTASNIGQGLIQFGFAWLMITIVFKGFLTKDTEKPNKAPIKDPVDPKKDLVVLDEAVTETMISVVAETEHESPDDFISHLSVFTVGQKERDRFHPVVMFPHVWEREEVIIPAKTSKASDGSSVVLVPERTKILRKRVPQYTVLDLTKYIDGEPVDDDKEESNSSVDQSSCTFVQKLLRKCDASPRKSKKKGSFHVGKYNEKRAGLYNTPLFQNKSNDIDGYRGKRTIHMGIDLFGPVGQKVFAFTDGIIHSVGYNAEPGDYGNVIVLEHEVGIKLGCEESETSDAKKQKLWVLYGHLDSRSIKGKKVGRRIKRGRMIGRMGDVHENGGWSNPHVHMQLSIHPPETHDMPGVVSDKDRDKALLQYPDPRIILGELY